MGSHPSRRNEMNTRTTIQQLETMNARKHWSNSEEESPTSQAHKRVLSLRREIKESLNKLLWYTHEYRIKTPLVFDIHYEACEIFDQIERQIEENLLAERGGDNE